LYTDKSKGMSISAHDIANVLRTYQTVLRLEKKIPSDERIDFHTRDIADISKEGKQRLQSSHVDRE